MSWVIEVGHCCFYPKGDREKAYQVPALPSDALAAFSGTSAGRTECLTPDRALARLRELAKVLDWDPGRAVVARFQLGKRWFAWCGAVYGVTPDGRLETLQ